METEGLRLTVAVVTFAIAYLWFGLLYALIRAYADPITVGKRFLVDWLCWPFILGWDVIRELAGRLRISKRKVRLLQCVAIFVASWLFGWYILGCSLPPSCPYADVADTVAIMGRNSRGVVDTLGLSITHRRVCG